MKLDIDVDLKSSKVEDLVPKLEEIFQKLFAILQKQPNFHLDTDPSTPIPNSLEPNTIVFQLTATNTLRLGIFDGDHVNTST